MTIGSIRQLIADRREQLRAESTKRHTCNSGWEKLCRSDPPFSYNTSCKTSDSTKTSR